jgi:hypothetical protein
MVRVGDLKEIVELEILLRRNHLGHLTGDLEQIKSLAIRALQTSECHKNCRCKHKCGCAVTGECQSCNPPKRILRIKEYICDGTDLKKFTIREQCLKVIRVSPRQVLYTK